MRGRVIGLGLIALGAFLLAGALAVRLFLEPALVKLPLDQTAEPTAVGTDVSFLETGTLRQREGLDANVAQKVVGEPDAPEAGDDVAVWNFGSTIHDSDGAFLNASTYRVCLDRRTAESVECDSAHVDYDHDVAIEGLTLTFPFGTEQRDYDVFNSTTRQAFSARFVGTEEIEGLEVYRFEMTIPETVIRTVEVPGSLVGSDEFAVDADVVYSNERIIWVEPVSGVIVTSEERPDTVLRGPDGAEGPTVLAGTFAGDDATIAAGVERAEDYRSQISLVKTTLPLSLGGVGLLALIGGLLLIRRDPAVGRHSEVAEADQDAHRVPQPQ